MLKKIFLAILFSGICLAQTSREISIKIDVTPMEQLFEIMNILKQDKEPTESQWKALLATPGYKTMLKNETNRGPLFYTDCIRIACKPSLNSQYEKYTREPQEGWGKVMAASLPHFRKARDEQSKLEELVFQLKNSQMNSQIISLANDYLPTDTPGKEATISFILFGPDARGYDTIVVDALFYTDLGKEGSHMLAHELHHNLRNQWEKSLLSNEETLIWVIRQIMLEGIADRINIAPQLTSSDSIIRFTQNENGRDYMNQLNRCPEIIRSMDDLLLKMAKDPYCRESLSQDFYKLVPRSGHLPGYYMATLIELQLGKDILIKDQINPVTFFLLYDEAAQKDGKAPRFSEGSKAYLRHLGRYFIPFKF